MRVIFMGTPEFACPALRALIDSAHTVIAAYCQPPRPAGRGMKLTPSPVQQLAEHHGIPVLTPTSLKTPESQAVFAGLRADIAVVAAYGLLLPQAILDAPPLGCINIHPSALPRWRGAAPLQRTLMAGDTATECCIMQMDAGLDTGAVLLREPFSIPDAMDYDALHDAMAARGAALTLQALVGLEAGTIHATAQGNEGITYAEKLGKADRVLDWARPAPALRNQIRALSPTPGATTGLLGETVKIFDAEIAVGDAAKPPGAVLDDDLRINAGDGTALRPLLLQRPGKARQPLTAFLQGFPVPAGTNAKNPI